MTNDSMTNPYQKRPHWLKKRLLFSDIIKTKSLLRGFNLHTVCEEALCPNISECFGRGVATFLILGGICSRRCRFCNVKAGRPSPIDRDESERVARAVRAMNIKHVVITSVTRDDIPDGGAGMFCETVLATRRLNPDTAIEILVPDFSGNVKSIRTVCELQPDIIGHNVETVPRLYYLREGADYVRSLNLLKEVSGYVRSLDLLEEVGIYSGNCRTKSGIMLGLGETDNEVVGVMQDLRSVGCEFLSIGQYLSPCVEHFPVQDYIKPEKFEWYKNKAGDLGFSYTVSGPYVRSSYMADVYL